MLKLLNVSLSVSTHKNLEHIDRQIVDYKDHRAHEKIKPRGII